MSCHKRTVCVRKDEDRQSKYLWLPRLSSWASSSSRSSSQDDWETAVPAGDTCRPSHTCTNKYCVFSVCGVWLFWLARVNKSQSRQIFHCFPVCTSPLFFSSPPPPVFDALASSNLTWRFPPFASKNLNDLPELDYLPLSLLFSPSLSLFLWRLFLCLCPQEASTDRVLSPSAFPEAHSSRMGR